VDAIALKFDPDEDAAPVVLIKGEGELARRILDAATQSEIPVISNPDVIRILKNIPEGSEIPENLYRAVSSIYALLHRLNGEI
jgi:type III secretion system FlhB-like substrate exporter